MKKDVLTIGLITLVIGLVLWFIVQPASRYQVAIFGFAGLLITLIGLAITIYGSISKPKKV